MIEIRNWNGMEWNGYIHREWDYLSVQSTLLFAIFVASFLAFIEEYKVKD